MLGDHLDSLPSAGSRMSRLLWGTFALALVGGLGAWAAGAATGSIPAGLVALWLFALAAVAVALVLPLPMALVSGLYMGLAGWLVDMLPLVILVGWATAVARWVYGLVRERRLPRSGRWIWLPVFLVAWTALGVLVVAADDFKRFLLLLALQALSSGAMLAVVDSAASRRDRATLVSGLLGFVLISTGAVALQYVGVPVEALQHEEVGEVAESAYEVHAFPTGIGMVKYTLSSRGGAGELRQKLDTWADSRPDVPPYDAFLPTLGAYRNQLVVRFSGSARAFEAQLDDLDIGLIYDNVGLAPANTVPRWRSFARSSLAYAGICVALLPFAFHAAWAGEGRRRLLGRAAVAACLAGAGFSLARGAWVAILIAILYLVIDGRISGPLKRRAVAVYTVAALALTAIFLWQYGIDPVNARAGGEGSVSTRAALYEDTVRSLERIHLVVGFGTEAPRSIGGHRYIPRAGTHSTYLNYLYRTGIPGALAVVLLYATAALHARAAALQRPGPARLFGTLAAAAVVAVAAHAAILNLFVEPMYTLVVSLVVGLAMAAASNLPSSVLRLGPPR